MGFPNNLTGYALELSDVTNPNFVPLSGANSALVKNFGGSLVASINGGAYAPLGGTSGYPLGVRQIVNSYTGVVASGSTAMPRDNTIPHITEGNLFLTVSITPQSATSTLVIFVSLMLASGVPNSYQAAVFRDAGVNALGVQASFQANANEMGPISLQLVTPSGSVAPSTFTVRAGCSTATPLQLNGTAGVQQFGGTASSGITIVEFGV